MKINNISSYKPSFGYVSKRTIDMMRRQVEGYKTETNNASIKGYYDTSSAYQFFSHEQLKRLYELTRRASNLEKSVIDTSGNNWEENFQQNIVVHSHCYGGGDRSNAGVFQMPYNSIYEVPESNPDKVLDVFEKAVEYAEEVEKDECAHYIFDEYGWHGGVREEKELKREQDRLRTEYDNIILNDIYDYALNLRTVK